MRSLVLLAMCSSGCLISDPEGTSQSWPPQLGGTVEAVTAGDLDGNGSTEVLVYMSGDQSQAGIYKIVGGKDFSTGSSPVKSFSLFIPDFLTSPMAAVQISSPAPTVYVARSTDPVAIKSYSNVLAVKSDIDTSVPSGTAVLWAHPIMFPGGMVHIAVSNGGSIDHVPADLSDTKPIPAPNGPSWDLAQLATSYASGSDQIAVVATATQIVRSPVPTSSNPLFVWTTVRSGAAWVGQASVDLDGDGREEIIGLDLAGKQVCAVDPGATTVPVTPICLAIPTLSTASEVTLLAGTNVTTNPGPDVIIAQSTGSETQYSLVEDYTYAAGALSSTMVRLIPASGPPHARTVIVNSGPGTPSSVISFGTDAAANCIQGPC